MVSYNIAFEKYQKVKCFRWEIKKKKKRKKTEINRVITLKFREKNFPKVEMAAEIKRVDLRSNSYAPRRRIIMFDNITVYTDNLLSHTRLDFILSYWISLIYSFFFFFSFFWAFSLNDCNEINMKEKRVKINIYRKA